MIHDNESMYADVIICNKTSNWHDRYYISKREFDENCIYYDINRGGLEWRLPQVFYVKRNETLRCNVIICVLRGRGEVYINGKTYALTEGTTLLLPAHVSHQYASDYDNPMGTVWIEFYGGESTKYMNEIINICTPVIHGAITMNIINKLSTLVEKLVLNPEQIHSVAIYDVLFTLIMYAGDRKSMRITDNIKNNMTIFEAYIDAHLSEKITNKKLANIECISIQYLIRLFKKSYGMSPQSYIMQRRLKQAAYFLSESQASVNDISLNLGFCNSGHFNKRFKEYFKVTPSQYRQKNRSPLYLYQNIEKN